MARIPALGTDLRRSLQRFAVTRRSGRRSERAAPRRDNVKRSMLVKFFIVWAAAKLLVGIVSPVLAQASTDLAPLVILVRHAEKACTNSDDDPPLSQAGKKRAEALAAALASAGVKRVITTDFRRTNETAGPLAQALALQPVVINLKNGPTDLPAHI